MWRKRISYELFPPLVLGLVLIGSATAGPLKIAPRFSDHMVLQCEQPIYIWGEANPGEALRIELGETAGSTRADMAGNWDIELPASKASAEPLALRVIGETRLELRDVLIGEVWLCAGQSNMEFPLANEATAATALPSANHPKLRLLDLRAATRGIYGTPFSAGQCSRLTAARYYTGSWQVCEPQAARDFSAIGYFFGRALHQRLSVPVGMIHVAVGGSPTEAWIRKKALAADPELARLVAGNWLENPALGLWCRERGHQNLDKPLAAGDVPADALGPNHPYKPSFLWEAGVAPLVSLGFRGVLWYQGESNSLELWRVHQHERLFPLLVNDWREQSHRPNLPFLFCQLSSIGTERGYQSQFWPDFRDQQRRLAETLGHCGMAVTSDVGHPSDVHPRDKHTVAARLLRAALAIAYRQDIEYRGPTPLTARLDGETLRVKFDRVPGGLRTSDAKPPRSFEVAGEDRQFVPAEATIRGELVELRQPKIAEPRFLRYGWRPYSRGNLVNGEGLPASTFEIRIAGTPAATNN